jgi:hypothetical protein
LWGALSNPETVTFTLNDYRRAVANNPTFAEYLAPLTLSQPHLFIGAGIDTITEYLAATPVDPSQTHYALVPETEGINVAREVFRQRGVELLIFRPSPGWPEVREFVDRLAKFVRTKATSVRAPAIEPILLTKIELKNIGPIQNMTLDLDERRNVLLGNNATGKSTVLRAIALIRRTFHGPDCKPHFVGVWDTVSSVGWIENPLKLRFTADNRISRSAAMQSQSMSGAPFSARTYGGLAHNSPITDPRTFSRYGSPVTLTVAPVIFPPGRAKLATIPASTGTATIPTIGIVAVVALKSSTRLLEAVTITSGLRRTTSRAKSA